MKNDNQELTDQEKALIIESWVRQYKIKKFVIQMPDKVYFSEDE
jgi:hypothetical protein